MHAALPKFAALRPIMWGGLALLLVAPLIAMRFTGEVRWGAEDFLAAAMLLAGLGAAVEIVMRVVAVPLARTLLIGGAAVCALLLWAEGAVGIFR
jgi:hypothetical protein